MDTQKQENDVTKIAQDYYDSHDADAFYAHVWGGQDIHVGIYETGAEPILEASHRTVRRMAELVSVTASTRILDIGAGYGGAARYLARKFGTKVICLNLSRVQNERNRALVRKEALEPFVDVVDGSFENIPLSSNSIDIVWSEDAILHSGDKPRVFSEVARVLRPNGQFLFTDPMQADDCDPRVLQPILDRIHLESMGSFSLYRRLAIDAGLSEVQILDLSDQLPTHYQRVHDELSARRAELLKVCSRTYLDRMTRGLLDWVSGGKKRDLTWGILHFEKRLPITT